MSDFQNPLFVKTPDEIEGMIRRRGELSAQIHDHNQQLVRLRAGRVRLVREMSALDTQIKEQQAYQKSDAAETGPTAS